MRHQAAILPIDLRRILVGAAAAAIVTAFAQAAEPTTWSFSVTTRL